MWLDETTKRYYYLYPEILGIDVTFRTNAKKYSLFNRYSKAINLHNLLNIFAFIPSNEVLPFSQIN